MDFVEEVGWEKPWGYPTTLKVHFLLMSLTLHWLTVIAKKNEVEQALKMCQMTQAKGLFPGVLTYNSKNK